MTNLAKIRIKVNKLDDEIQQIKTDLEKVVINLSKTKPLGKSKETD